MQTDITGIGAGWKVYPIGGEDLGEVDAVDRNEITVRKGWLLPSERYVPASAVQSVDPDAESVFLGLTKAQLEDGAYGESLGVAADDGLVDADYVAEGAGPYVDLTEGATALGTDETAAYRQDASGQAAAADGTTRIRTHEEELQAQPVTQQAGEVVITKDIVEETRTIEVPVRHEEIRIERRAVTDATADPTASREPARRSRSR